MSVELDAPGAGHNAPPSDADILRERLEAENADLLARLAQLMQSAKMAPDMPADDDDAGNIADLAKMFHALEKAAGGRIAAERLPHNVALGAIAGYYKPRLTDHIDAAKLKLRQGLVDYLIHKPADSDGKVRVRGTNGSVATLKASEAVVVDNPNKLDGKLLLEYVGGEAIDKAIAAYHKATGLVPAGCKLVTRYSAVVS